MSKRPSGQCRLAIHALLIGGLTATGCGTHPAFTPYQPLSQLPAKYAQVDYDSVFQTPRHVVNREALGASQYPPPRLSDLETFQTVRQFLILYAPVFHLRPGIDDFTPSSRVFTSPGEKTVGLQQTYRGLPVDGMGYGSAVLWDGSVSLLLGRFMPDINVSVVPAIGSDVARSSSIAALAPTVVAVAQEPTLRIATFGDVPRLAWLTTVKSTSTFAAWYVVVDAQTGAVVSVQPAFIN